MEGGRLKTVSKHNSIILDSLRPNNCWLRPMRAADPKDRWKITTDHPIILVQPARVKRVKHL